MSRGTWTARFRIDPDLWERLGRKHADRSGWLRARVEAEVNGNGAAQPVTEDVATPVDTDGLATWQREEAAAFGVLSRTIIGWGGQRGAVIADLLSQLRDAVGRPDWTLDRIYGDSYQHRHSPLHTAMDRWERGLDGRKRITADEARSLVINAAIDAYGAAADQYHYLREEALKSEARERAEAKATHDTPVPYAEPAKGTRQLVSQAAALLDELAQRDPETFARRVRKADRQAAYDELEKLPGEWAEEAREALELLDW